MNNQDAQTSTPAERGLPELNVSWSDHFARQGDMAMSHNYAAFKAAESWILANMPALSRPLPSDWVAVHPWADDLRDTGRGGGQLHCRAWFYNGGLR